MVRQTKTPGVMRITVSLPKPTLDRLRKLKEEGKIISISEAIRNGLALFFEAKTYVSMEPGTPEGEI